MDDIEIIETVDLITIDGKCYTTNLCDVDAFWEYVENSISEGKGFIKIETDENKDILVNLNNISTMEVRFTHVTIGCGDCIEI